MIVRRSAALLMLSLVVAGTARAGEWRKVYPQSEPPVLVDVTHDDGRWAAVDLNGEVLESPDGLEWTVTGRVEFEPPPSTSPAHLALGAGTLVVVSRRGLAAVRNPDGTWHHNVWTGVSSPADIHWDGRRFVVIGDDRVSIGWDGYPPENGLLASSPDGLEWTTDLVVPEGSVLGGARVVSGDRVRIGVGLVVGFGSDSWDGSFVTAVSQDDEPWQQVSSGLRMTYVDWNGDRFVAIDSEGAVVGAAGELLTSQDGRTWQGTGISMPVSGHDLACGGGRCVALGRSSFVEIDLAAATAVEVPAFGDFSSTRVGCSDERCVVVGPNRTILVSDRAGTWDVVLSHRQPRLAAVAEHDGTWVAVGFPRPPSVQVLYSHDGVAWAPARVPDPTVALADVAWAGDAFTAVGEAGFVLESADGAVWHRAPLPTTEPVAAIAGDGRGAVAVGGHLRGALLTRQPGGTWSEVTMALPRLSDIVWDGRRYLVAGAEGTLLESPDGDAWRPIAGLGSDDLDWVASNGRRVLVGGLFGVLTTVDGTVWDAIRLNRLAPVSWTGRGFMRLGYDPEWSPDGLSWGVSGLRFENATGVASSAGLSVVVSGDGRIFTRQGTNTPAERTPWKGLIPVVGTGDGGRGRAWTSELWAGPVQKWWNPLSEATAFLLTGSTGARSAEARDLLVQTSGRYLDPVAEMFGTEGGAGALVVSADEPYLLGASVISSAEGRRFRQVVPPATIEDTREPRLLPLLGSTEATHVNLALANPHDGPVEALVEVVADDGGVRGRLQVSLTPWSSWLVTDVVRRATGGDALVDPLLRILPLDERPAPVALASIVDDATGDPITVISAAVSDEALAVPAVAHNPGFGTSLWRSDLMLHNPGPFAARFRLELHPLDDWRTVHRTPWLELAAGASVRYPDLVESVFGRGGTGWLRVALSSGRLAGASRTYDIAASSPLGHPVPAVDEASVRHDATVWAGTLRVSRSRDGGVRSRLGIVNLDSRPQSVEIRVHRSDDGRRLTNLQLAVRPGHQEFRELAPNPLWFLGGESEASIIVEATPGTQRSRLLVFGSNVDAATGDAQLVIAAPPF